MTSATKRVYQHGTDNSLATCHRMKRSWRFRQATEVNRWLSPHLMLLNLRSRLSDSLVADQTVLRQECTFQISATYDFPKNEEEKNSQTSIFAFGLE